MLFCAYGVRELQVCEVFKAYSLVQMDEMRPRMQE